MHAYKGTPFWNQNNVRSYFLKRDGKNIYLIILQNRALRGPSKLRDIFNTTH